MSAEPEPLSVLPAATPFRFPQRLAALRDQIAAAGISGSPSPAAWERGLGLRKRSFRTGEGRHKRGPGGEGPNAEGPGRPIDALLVSYLDNVQYLTGFTGSSAMLLITPDRALFLTDGRYALQSAQQALGFDRVVLMPGRDMTEAVIELIGRLGLRRVGYEKDQLTVASLEGLAALVPDGGAELVGVSNLVEAVRCIKDAEEVAAIRRAIAAADACFAFVCETARVGMTERELAWEMEVFLRRERGAEKLAFDSIVGSGPNSALIHGRPGDRRIGESGESEFLLLDFGAQLGGYCSDLTRTLVIGGEPTPRMRDLYDAVLEAQRTAITAIRADVAGRDVDTAARESLRARNLADAFAHGLGHGLGRSVHDHIALSQRSTLTLAAGMVLTVEPGAYIEGFGGVRIEDDVLVTESGCEVLTQSPKELIRVG
jgi:Xaa-Pro aminopeptidase